MKRCLLIVTLALMLSPLSLAFIPLLSLAESNPSANSPDSISITVVIPPAEEPLPPEPEIIPPVNYLYPASVVESQESGKKMLIKIYELSPLKNPNDISRESFTRNNLLYELADITKVENVSLNQREHTETITVNSGSREMEAI